MNFGLSAAIANRVPWALRGLFAIALVFVLREAKPFLAPVFIAAVLTFVLSPLVRWLRRRGVPEVWGAALVVTALIGSTVPLAASLAQPAAQWWQRAPTTLAQAMAQVDRLRAAIPGLEPPLAARAPPPQSARGAPGIPPSTAPVLQAPDHLKERLANEGFALGGLLLGHGAAFALSTTASLILLYFLLASEHWMLACCIEAVPRRRTRALVLGGVRSAQRQISRYVLALSGINLAVGVATGLSVHALGLANPTLWGVVAAVLCFVPYIGPLMIFVMLLLAGMLSFSSFAAMVAPALAFMFIHALESNLIGPWVVSRRLALSAISVFLSVMFWGWLWGIAGALIAVPILIGIRSVAVRDRRLRLLRRFLEGHRQSTPSLRSLLGVAPRARRQPHRALDAAAAASEALQAAQLGGHRSLPAAAAAATEPLPPATHHRP